jgi:alkylation response protein AidB-like acyl-CoA dehydrogenase
MDFEVTYTKEQEMFRDEVRGWLKTNIPADLKANVDESDLTVNTEAHFRQALAFRKKLGEKGWLVPHFPTQYGGGGLQVDKCIVLAEELAEYDLPGVALSDNGTSLAAPAIMVWGTDEQKQRFLPPILKGEVVTWQVFTEPNAGSDLASMQTTAIREGDEFVFNGSKHFVGFPHQPDYLYTLAVTDPNAPRHQNIGAFLVPAKADGVTLGYMDLVGAAKRTVFFDNARISATQRSAERATVGRWLSLPWS